MTIEERLEKIEKELAEARRRNRWLLTIMGLVVVGIGLAWILTKTTAAATATTAPKVIRANDFIVENANGKTRAELSVDKDGPRLGLLDEKGKPRAELGIDKDKSGLKLGDANGKVIWKAP